MSILKTSAWLTLPCLLAASLLPSVAHAKSLDRCGGVFLSASSVCVFKPTQECMTTCATTSVEQTCAQKTYSMCSAGCTTTDVTTCTKTRASSCATQCDTITTKSSNEVCVSECSDTCSSSAVSKGHFGGDRDKCSKNCAHDCNEQCNTCSTTDQSTDCTTKCMSVVQSECLEEVNRECVLSCQTDNYTSCETETVNTCNTSCQTTGGALFCDGQFIEASDLQACVDQLASEFSFNIDISAHVAVSGNGAVTTTNKDGSKTTTKCSFSPPTRGQSGMALGALAMLGVAVTRRRRRSL